MLSPTEERIIFRAARAQRAYWQLVKRFDEDSRRKLALFNRYIEVQAELRGDRRTKLTPLGPVDCWIPLRQAVQQEIIRRTPQITFDVASARDTRRRAVGCGYVALALSAVARVRRKLRRVIWLSGLSIREAASAIGVSSTTIENHLGGRRPSLERMVWYDRLESIVVEDDQILIIVRREAPSRKKYGWRKPLDLFDEA